MFNLSIKMVQTRSMTAESSNLEPTTSTNSLLTTGNSTTVAATENKTGFRSIMNRLSKTPERNTQFTITSPVNMNLTTDLERETQSSITSPVNMNVTTIKNSKFTEFLVEIIKKIPTILGIFGGCHALYQIYMANVEEKLEVVVLRRY